VQPLPLLLHRLRVYRLRLLGEANLAAAGAQPVSLGRVGVALLVLLARAPDRTLSRERIAALLWPDAAAAAARRALRQLVFRLRAEAPELLTADRERIALGESVDIDVEAFEVAARNGACAEAAELYDAALLYGFALPGSAEFEQWLDRERAALQRLAADVFEQCVDAASGRGAWTEACDTARRWLAAEPYSERAAARLFAAVAQSSGSSAALAEWEEFRRRLERDLGVPPSPALERVAERIQRSASQRTTVVEATLLRPQRRDATPNMSPELPFVGREDEYARMNACWRRAEQGQRQLVLLRGEAGIGKTRLAAELAQWAASAGATVLHARAYEVEAGVPYAALSGALRGALRAPGLSGVEADTLTGLGRIVPAFATRFATAVTASESAFETGSLRLLDAVRDLFDSLAHEAPLLLFVDDLPWADDASITALHYAWRTLSQAPLMILATARGTTDADLRGAGGFIATATRETEACTIIDVGPLPHAAVEALTRRAFDGPIGPALDADDLERRSGGNPLFLSELLRAAAEGAGEARTTQTIRLVARGRIGALDDNARALLQSAAILGRQFPLRVAGAVARLDVAAAAHAVDVLGARGLLRQEAYGYDFVHDVVRETVLDDVGAATRRLLHERAFQQLRPVDEAEVGAERAGALAHHSAAAGLRPEAYYWHRRAARAAIALYAPAEASRALRAALEHADDDDQRRDTWIAVAELARIRADFRGAAYAFRRAFEYATDDHERLRLKLRMLHMGARGAVLAVDEIDALGASLRKDAERAGDGVLAELLFVLADTAARSGDLDSAVERAAAATAAHRRAGEAQPLVRALLLHASICSRRGDDGALALLHEAEHIARMHELDLEVSDVQVEIATELSRLGQWDEAIDGFVRVIAEAAPGGFGNVPIARLNAADLHARRGEWDAARHHLAELARICDRFHFPHVAAAYRLNEALLEWLRGHAQQARSCAQAARLAAEQAGIRAVGVAAAAVEALACLELGEVDKAATLLDESMAVPASFHATWSDDSELLVAARARLLAARDERDAAVALLAEARTAAREPHAVALLTAEHAALLMATAPASAAALAREAADAARALGAAPLLERAEALLFRPQSSA
jgi:DNA-binding SARP family transcriptional activator